MNQSNPFSGMCVSCLLRVPRNKDGSALDSWEKIPLETTGPLFGCTASILPIATKKKKVVIAQQEYETTHTLYREELWWECYPCGYKWRIGKVKEEWIGLDR